MNKIVIEYMRRLLGIEEGGELVVNRIALLLVLGHEFGHVVKVKLHVLEVLLTTEESRRKREREGSHRSAILVLSLAASSLPSASCFLR